MDIYKQASLVCVWLGESDSGTELAAKVIADVVAQVEEHTSEKAESFIGRDGRFCFGTMGARVLEQMAEQVGERMGFKLESTPPGGDRVRVKEAFKFLEHKGPRSELDTPELLQKISALV